MNTNGGYILIYFYFTFLWQLYQFFFFTGYQGISFIVGHGCWWRWWGLLGVFQHVGLGYGILQRFFHSFIQLAFVEVCGLCMMPHCVQSSHEIWEAPLTYQPKAVVPSVKMIHHGALILPLLPAPRTEQETSLTLEGHRGVYPLKAHDLRGFEGWHHPEVVEVLGQSPSHVIGGVELLFAPPLVPNHVNFGVHKAHHFHHFFEDVS